MTEGDSAADAGDQGVRMLEHQLDLATRWGHRAVAELHRLMSADLAAAEKRAQQAERRLRKVRRRARRAEAELAQLRASRGQKAVRIAAAVPGRIRRVAGRSRTR